MQYIQPQLLTEVVERRLTHARTIFISRLRTPRKPIPQYAYVCYTYSPALGTLRICSVIFLHSIGSTAAHSPKQVEICTI